MTKASKSKSKGRGSNLGRASARIVPLNTPKNQAAGTGSPTESMPSGPSPNPKKASPRKVHKPLRDKSKSVSPGENPDLAVEALFSPATDFLLERFGSPQNSPSMDRLIASPTLSSAATHKLKLEPLKPRTPRLGTVTSASRSTGDFEPDYTRSSVITTGDADPAVEARIAAHTPRVWTSAGKHDEARPTQQAGHEADSSDPVVALRPPHD